MCTIFFFARICEEIRLVDAAAKSTADNFSNSFMIPFLRMTHEKLWLPGDTSPLSFLQIQKTAADLTVGAACFQQEKACNM